MRMPSHHSREGIAYPWDYNPSEWGQRIPICVLAAVAFFIAAYMALFQWGLVGSVWDPIWGEQSERVLKSKVAEGLHGFFRIPDAAMGAFAYLGDAVLGLAGSTRRWHTRPWLTILFGIDVMPLGAVSAVLVFLQATVVGNWCFLCIVTAIISLVLIWFAYDEVWSCLLFLWAVWKRTRSGRVLWNAFWGRPSDQINQIAIDFMERRKQAREQQLEGSRVGARG